MFVAYPATRRESEPDVGGVVLLEAMLVNHETISHALPAKGEENGKASTKAV
jgi:hypothetical protein